MSDPGVRKILQLAADIEEKAERFYENMAKHAADEKQRELFQYLAVEEDKHKDILNHMISCIKEEDGAGEWPGNYFDFLSDYAANSVFDLGGAEEKLAPASDLKSALSLAMQRELESIAFYQEIKDFIEEELHPLIDKIIREERQHFGKLSQVKEILSAA